MPHTNQTIYVLQKCIPAKGLVPYSMVNWTNNNKAIPRRDHIYTDKIWFSTGKVNDPESPCCRIVPDLVIAGDVVQIPGSGIEPSLRQP